MTVKTLDQDLEDFLSRLERPAHSRVMRMIDLLRTFGSNLRMPYSKSLGGGLFELRARGQQEIRIFYTFFEDYAVLLHGFVKKTEQTPAREIQTSENKKRALTAK